MKTYIFADKIKVNVYDDLYIDFSLLFRQELAFTANSVRKRIGAK